jgi:UDPglucose--hexose-1-phosphate uridylyltransferase
MSTEALAEVVAMWRRETSALRAIPFIRSVQIFENSGAMMGASNPHPHCQIWATESVPNELAKEDSGQMSYFGSHGTCLLCAYAELERSSGRMLFDNECFTAMVLSGRLRRLRSW